MREIWSSTMYMKEGKGGEPLRAESGSFPVLYFFPSITQFAAGCANHLDHWPVMVWEKHVTGVMMKKRSDGLPWWRSG